MDKLVLVSTVASVAYMLVVYAGYSLLLIFAGLDNAIRSREGRAENLEMLEVSRFTIPVSLIVPVFNESPLIVNVIGSLQHLRYPETELIVVNDGSTDDTLAVLMDALELEPTVRFARNVVDTSAIRGVYRSRSDPRVVVIDKVNGGKADALNVGLNHARFRYVCCLDGDTIYFPTALLNTMRLVVRDPARVVGVTGHIAVATRPEQLSDDDGRRRADKSLISSFQHMEYLRSFLNNRLAWSRFNFMLCASGAFAIWRRDLLEELGGFSTQFTCEDIEMTFRAHEHLRRLGRDYRILSTPEIVARTEGPATVRALVSQRERWLRVTLETVWHYRRAVGRRRYGAVGLVGLPFYVLSEALAPFVEVLALVTLGIGVAIHVFDWRLYLVFFASMAFANAILTTSAILMEDISTRAYRLSHLARLIALSPLEIAAYRPILAWARIKGAVRFARRDRSWRKIDRNPRPVST